MQPPVTRSSVAPDAHRGTVGSRDDNRRPDPVGAPAGVRRRLVRRVAVSAVALGVVVVAALVACGPDGSTLPFAKVASTTDYSGEPGRVLVAPDAVKEEWAALDDGAWPALDDRHVRLLVVPGTQYRGAEVTDVRRVDDAWVVHLVGYDSAKCSGVDLLMSAAYLVDVSADTAPAAVRQTVEVRSGC